MTRYHDSQIDGSTDGTHSPHQRNPEPQILHRGSEQRHAFVDWADIS